jgi:hypothetical protein
MQVERSGNALNFTATAAPGAFATMSQPTISDGREITFSFEPPPRTIVEEAALEEGQGGNVTATLTTSGPKLASGDVQVSDGAITDGRASLQLRGDGIQARVGRRTAGALTMAIARKGDALTLTFKAAPGAFETMTRPELRGNRVVVSFTVPPPPDTGGGSSGSGSSGGGSTGGTSSGGGTDTIPEVGPKIG